MKATQGMLCRSHLGVVSKRLPHSTVIGWGSLFGHKPKRPAPVTLQGLPIDQSKSEGAYAHRFIATAAGQTHACFLCDTGELVMLGGNRYGQSGRPNSQVSKPALTEGSKSGLIGDDVSAECTPLYFDLGFQPNEAPNAVSCGSNYSLVYRKGGRTVVGVGNNHMGQQGVGHKQTWGNDGGFAEWAPEPDWAMREPFTTVEREVLFLCEPVEAVTNSEQEMLARKRIQKSRLPGEQWTDCWARQLPLTIAAPVDTQPTNDIVRFGIKEIVCGTNHTMIWLNNDVVYACGSNLVGELGIGHTRSPMVPVAVWSLDRHICRVEGVHRDDTDAQLVAVEASPPVESPLRHLGSWRDIWSNRRLKQIACGNGFSMFLTVDGRVFGCGSNRYDQLGHVSFEVEPVNPSRPNPDTHQPALVKVKHIAAIAEMAVFVSVNNEVLVRGGIEGMGVFTHDRLHPVLPLEGDVVSEARIASLLQRKESKGPLSDAAREGLAQQFRQRHPPIVAVWGREQNVFLQYDDGRIVGFGVNLDGQVQIIDGGGMLLRRRLSGGDDMKVSTDKAANYAPSCMLDKVSLMCPACEGVVGKTHVAVGMGFVLMVIEGDAPYEDVLAGRYRAERDLKRSVGIKADDIVMTDILLPPVVPEEVNPPPANYAPPPQDKTKESTATVEGGARGALPGRRGVLSKAIFRNVPTVAPPGAYGAPLSPPPGQTPSATTKANVAKRKIVW